MKWKATGNKKRFVIIKHKTLYLRIKYVYKIEFISIHLPRKTARKRNRSQGRLVLSDLFMAKENTSRTKYKVVSPKAAHCHVIQDIQSCVVRAMLQQYVWGNSFTEAISHLPKMYIHLFVIYFCYNFRKNSKKNSE